MGMEIWITYILFGRMATLFCLKKITKHLAVTLSIDDNVGLGCSRTGFEITVMSVVIGISYTGKLNLLLTTYMSN